MVINNLCLCPWDELNPSMVLAFVVGMLFLYIMRKIETPASFHLATLAGNSCSSPCVCRRKTRPVIDPDVMPVLNSCALIEDRTERETCSNQGIMEHIINKLEYPRLLKMQALKEPSWSNLSSTRKAK